jgi:hypothetical protein
MTSAVTPTNHQAVEAISRQQLQQFQQFQQQHPQYPQFQQLQHLPYTHAATPSSTGATISTIREQKIHDIVHAGELSKEELNRRLHNNESNRSETKSLLSPHASRSNRNSTRTSRSEMPTWMNVAQGRFNPDVHSGRLKTTYAKHLETMNKARAMHRLANFNNQKAEAEKGRAAAAWMPWTKMYHGLRAFKLKQRAWALRTRAGFVERAGTGLGEATRSKEITIQRKLLEQQRKDPSRKNQYMRAANNKYN